MIMDVIMSWMKIMVVLAGFFALSGERWNKKAWKYQFLTIFVILLCTLAGAVSFQKLSIRYMMEVSILFLYIVFYCQKELGRHFMYLLIAYVMLDVALVFGGIIAYILQRCSPGENYKLWINGTSVTMYISLFFTFLLARKKSPYVSDKKGFSIAEAGITVVLLVAEGAVFAFVESDEGSESVYPFYAFSFLSALVIGALWIADKRAGERQMEEKMQDYARYEHRMREVLPAVGRALEKLENLSENSGETTQIMAEIKEVCRTDEEITQAEILAAKTFASTGNSIFDGMLERYLQEAAQKGVDVEIIVRARVDEFLGEQKIDSGLFLQMFGDIYRNAYKVVSQKEGGGRILIYMGYNREKNYEISVSDNGAPFPRHVLEHLGERGVTIGGTGHGLADVFSIMDKYKISFFLEQKQGPSPIFTKTIRLVFDGKGSRVIR